MEIELGHTISIAEDDSNSEQESSKTLSPRLSQQPEPEASHLLRSGGDQAQAGDIADEDLLLMDSTVPTELDLESRRPSVVTLQPDIHITRAPSPVQGLFEHSPRLRHPAEEQEQLTASDDNDETAPGSRSASPMFMAEQDGSSQASSALAGNAATSNLPSFEESQAMHASSSMATTRAMRAVSSPPLPSPPISASMRRSASQLSHLSTSSNNNGTFVSVANSALARLSADVSCSIPLN